MTPEQRAKMREMIERLDTVREDPQVENYLFHLRALRPMIRNSSISSPFPNMRNEQLDARFHALGLDPDEEAAKIRQLLLQIVREFQEQHEGSTDE